MIHYIIYTLIGLGCSLSVYLCLLKKQKTFQFNRFFLISTLVLCLLAPIVEIEILNNAPNLTDISFQASEGKIFNDSDEILDGVIIEELQRSSYPIYTILFYLYLGISICLTYRFARNLISILKLTKNCQKYIGSLKLIEGSSQKNVSSFFNYLFINPENLKDKQYAKSVVQHEMIHAQQLHTLDIMLVELLICAFWFNPFIWVYKKVICQNHEFIADNDTIKSGIDIETFTNTIINSGSMEYRVPLTSGFNFIQIKNRIIMLHQSKSSALKRTIKTVIAIFLFSGIFMFSSFKDLKEPLIVVVDAGHGGHDQGYLNEKDIVLNISSELSKLSNDKIKIIRLRNTDKYVSLQDRVKFINKQNADIMISLHCNSFSKTTANGLMAFYSEKSENHKTSLKYSRILVNQQLEDVCKKGVLRRANFIILKEVKHPSVLMELGFLSNQEDNNRLNSSEHQQEIAKSLYKGLLEIRNQK